MGGGAPAVPLGRGTIANRAATIIELHNGPQMYTGSVASPTLITVSFQGDDTSYVRVVQTGEPDDYLYITDADVEVSTTPFVPSSEGPATPEPSTLALLGAARGLAGAWRLRGVREKQGRR
jgi:hypothetical protein